MSPSNHTLAIANVRSLEIEFFPAQATLCVQEEVFTPGTTFVKVNAGIFLPTYGGGYISDATNASLMKRLQEQGLYPGALQIGPTLRGASVQPAAKPMGKYCYVKDACLHIKLPAGLTLGGFEISCGDTYYDPTRPAAQQVNKDGHIGSLGNAKLFVRLTGEGRHFMNNVNVPPAGVLSGGPCQAAYVTRDNDEIIVESRHHPTWVMAYRVVFLQIIP